MTGEDDDIPTSPAPAPPPAVRAPIKTAEQWAEAKGMYPQFTEGGVIVPRNPGPLKVDRLGARLGAVSRKHRPDYWKFAAAKVLHGWPQGAELTEADFDAAIKAATETPI